MRRPPPLVDARRPLPVAARHHPRQHDPQRRPADAGARPRRLGQPAAVDRRRLHARLRRPAAHRRRARRPLRPQARPDRSASRLRRSARALSALAGTPEQLIAARGVMGVGGALIMPSTLSILTNVFPAARARQGDRHLGRRRRPRRRHRPGRRRLAARALLWGSVFLVNVPIVVVALRRRPRSCPSRATPQRRRSTCSAPCSRSSGLARCCGRSSRRPTAAGATAVVARRLRRRRRRAGRVRRWELRTPHPMLDLRFFRNPRFSAASAAISLVFFALFG